MSEKSQTKNEKILLMLMPYWDPQIPPLGIACIKSFLQLHGYEVKAVDSNLEFEFRQLFDEYYKVLKQSVPEDKQGNIFNIGNQVLRNHLTACLHLTQDERYLELVKILIQETFYTSIDKEKLKELCDIAETFFIRLKSYFFKVLDKEKPTVLGLSVYCDTFAASMAAFRWAKEKDPSIKTVMGGGIFSDQLAVGSPNLDFFLEYAKPFVDKVILGEGEVLFLKYLNGELPNSRRFHSLKDLKAAPLDLGTAGIPDFSDFNLRYYPHLAHYGSRSCPYQCKFCSETVIWGTYRKKETGQLVEELIRLYNKYSSQLFLLTDSTLNPIITDLSQQFIESGVTLYWDGFLRADKHVCGMENTLLWRRGGFYRAKLGLESGSPRMLDIMNKKITVDQVKDAIAALAYAGIKTTTMWIVGYPGETEDDFRQTLDFLEECRDNIYEADCNAFYYFLTGQVNSAGWGAQNSAVRLYPEWAKEMLVVETWILDGEPSRKVTFERINRFVEHCNKLNIPNPYSLSDINKADERWKSLHKNAVPPLVELNNRETYIDETQKIKGLSFAGKKLEDDGNWF